MKSKKCFILLMIIILIFLNLSNIYAYVQLIQLNTIDIQNIGKESNLYILLKNENLDEKKGIYKDYDDNLNDLIEKINKDAINIDREYRNNKLPKQLENTNQVVSIDGVDYKKIKVIGNVTIAWEGKYIMEDDNGNTALKDNVLIANIKNNNVELIDISGINVAGYHDGNIKGYGGNSVQRKAMIYDASDNKLKDITQSKVNEEKEKLDSIKEKNKKKENFLNTIRPIAFIIIVFIILPITVGLITEVIARKIKEKHK